MAGLETLISEWRLSRTTIWRALQKLERKGKLRSPTAGSILGPAIDWGTNTGPFPLHQVSA